MKIRKGKMVLRHRGVMPPATRQFVDRKKEAKKLACRKQGRRPMISEDEEAKE